MKKQFESPIQETTIPVHEGDGFRLDDESMIFDLLSNRLYVNKIESVVRETISNAIDSHRAAGQSKKVRVIAPTAFSPYFIIEDFGLGMSKKTVDKVFKGYGSSTKSSSNQEIGGFGIGAKSPNAYTESFELVSYYEGIEYTYLSHLDDKGKPAFPLLSEKPTKRENGVLVKIKVRPDDFISFYSALGFYDFFWHDLVKTENLDASYKESVKRVTTEGKYDFLEGNYCVELNSYARKFTQNARLIALVDCIPIPVDQKIWELIEGKMGVELLNESAGSSFVLSFNIGEVKPFYSRERLDLVESNVKAVENKLNHFFENVLSVLGKDYGVTKTSSALLNCARFSDFKNSVLRSSSLIHHGVLNHFGIPSHYALHLPESKTDGYRLSTGYRKIRPPAKERNLGFPRSSSRLDYFSPTSNAFIFFKCSNQVSNATHYFKGVLGLDDMPVHIFFVNRDALDVIKTINECNIEIIDLEEKDIQERITKSKKKKRKKPVLLPKRYHLFQDIFLTDIEEAKHQFLSKKNHWKLSVNDIKESGVNIDFYISTHQISDLIQLGRILEGSDFKKTFNVALVHSDELGLSRFSGLNLINMSEFFSTKHLKKHFPLSEVNKLQKSVFERVIKSVLDDRIGSYKVDRQLGSYVFKNTFISVMKKERLLSPHVSKFIWSRLYFNNEDMVVNLACPVRSKRAVKLFNSVNEALETQEHVKALTEVVLQINKNKKEAA